MNRSALHDRLVALHLALRAAMAAKNWRRAAHLQIEMTELERQLGGERHGELRIPKRPP